ncbi:MAG: glycerol-3-phosphate dehydrogenase [candidate division NC10 bacterium]|nr:glycerol-3-phosphate dehydrogenase [candidate division NC10 bacterium]
MAIVTIVGAGFMGSATAWPLADNGHTVRLVGTHLDAEIITQCKERRFHPKLQRELPPGVQPYHAEEITQAIEGAEIILSGVNSSGVRWIGQTLGPLLRPEHLLIAITKGLDLDASGDLKILPDVLRDELPENIRNQVRLAAIGGPCIAGELAGRRQTCVTFGCRDQAAVERLATAFRTPYYHVWTTTDLVGLEYCAALKNAYTVGVALAFGLLEKSGGTDTAGAHMHNLAAACYGQACTEMEQFLRIVGATRYFAFGLPGAGDLYVTCVGGRTIRLGTLLGKGHSIAEARAILAGLTLEGAAIIEIMGQALPRLEARGLVGPGDLPLLRALIAVIVHGQPLQLRLDAFFGGGGRV